jgi:mRNA interferase MazF
MKRGEVWVANFNPSRGSEAGKIRPALIVQADWLTSAGTGTVIALPLTTQLRKASEPLRVLLTARERLLLDSHIVVEMPRALDKTRIGEGPLTRLTAEEMRAVDRGLAAVLGLAIPPSHMLAAPHVT